MVTMGLSATEEKDERVQQLKKEIDDMVKARVSMMMPEVLYYFFIFMMRAFTSFCIFSLYRNLFTFVLVMSDTDKLYLYVISGY